MLVLYHFQAFWGTITLDNPPPPHTHTHTGSASDFGKHSSGCSVVDISGSVAGGGMWDCDWLFCESVFHEL